MSPRYIEQERLHTLNTQEIRQGSYVLYWMQQSQRAEENHALEFAIQQANERHQPLLVIFGLTDDYPEANLRHYRFMLEGLQETRRSLAERGIKMVVRRGHPVNVALHAGKEASLIVCDRGYVRHQKSWRADVAEQADCRVIQVEGDVVAPVEVVSHKAEYAARTIRPKIHHHLERFLVDVPTIQPEYSSLRLDIEGMELSHIDGVLEKLDIDRRVPAVSHVFQGGTTQAQARFQKFLAYKLSRYAINSNQPHTGDISGMSPYLHFGQISPLYLARQVQNSPFSLGKAGEAFLEQVLVRRELAMNFVEYTPDYDHMSCLPNWARKTLAEHRDDTREYLYTPEQLEQAETHDAAWNAAMKEMTRTGFLHNYMRMYWGKKILEWSETPEIAFSTTLRLNNTYFLDGRDPNSYTGVAWIYGVHDRAWAERPIFGKVRYMSASGLKRKCNIHAYIEKVERCE